MKRLVQELNEEIEKKRQYLKDNDTYTHDMQMYILGMQYITNKIKDKYCK